MTSVKKTRLSRLLLTGLMGATLALGAAACGDNADNGADDVFTEPGAGVPGNPEQDVTTPDMGPGSDADDHVTGADSGAATGNTDSTSGEMSTMDDPTDDDNAANTSDSK